jgi:hypothetical protein
MKVIVLLLFIGLIVLACGCTTQPTVSSPAVPTTAVPTASSAIAKNADAKDLIGEWIGTEVRYVDPVDFRENISVRYTITGQAGATFNGVKTFTKQSDGKTYTKNFTGVRDSRGILYISDEGQGYNIGRVTGSGALEIVHLVDGSVDYPRSWVGTFQHPSALNQTIVPVQVPNITGTWKGNNISFLRPGTYYNNITETLSVTGQKGPVFRGQKEVYKPRYGKSFVKNFTGVISSTGDVYIVDEEQGYNIGKVTTPDSFELVHMVDGAVDYPRVYLGTFNRLTAKSPAAPSGTQRNITGTWVVKNASIYVNPQGSFDTLSVKYTISSQNGPTFEGLKEVVKPSNGSTFTKNFTGVMTPTGDVFISDDKGYNIGRFTGLDTIELVHLADGTGIYPKTWQGIMIRQKN